MPGPLGTKLRKSLVSRSLHLDPEPYKNRSPGAHTRCRHTRYAHTRRVHRLASAAEHLLQLRKIGVTRLRAA